MDMAASIPGGPKRWRGTDVAIRTDSTHPPADNQEEAARAWTIRVVFLVIGIREGDTCRKSPGEIRQGRGKLYEGNPGEVSSAETVFRHHVSLSLTLRM